MVDRTTTNREQAPLADDMRGEGHQSQPVEVKLSASRMSLFLYAATWILFGNLLLFAAFHGFLLLDFSPANQSNRIVMVCFLLVLVPFTLVSAMVALRGYYWLLMSLWPSFLGIIMVEEGLLLCFPPWIRHTIPRDAVTLVYLFEMDEEEHGGAFEVYLPEAQHRRELLPQFRVAGRKEPLNASLLQYLCRSESEMIQQLMPAILAWRGESDEVLIDEPAAAKRSRRLSP